MPNDTRTVAARPDVDALEQRFGDPRAPDNPLGFAAILAADERGIPFAAGQLAYQEMVEEALGAVEDRAGLETELLRVVGRRDLRLALRCAEATGSDDSFAPALCVSGLDTCLRTTLTHTRRRRLHGAPVADFPAVRNVCTGTFVELLVTDAVCLAAIPAPRHELIEAAAVHRVGGALTEAVDRLSEVMGAYFYVREGKHGIFQKHLRDIREIALTNSALPGFHRTLLAIPLADARRLAGTVNLALDTAAGSPGLVAKLSMLADEFDALVRARPPDSEASGNDAPDAFERADRIAALVAAVSSVDVWLSSPPETFTANPSWLLLALHRLAPTDSRADRARLTEAEAEAEAKAEDEAEAEMWAELIARHDQSRSFWLNDRKLPDLP